MAIIDFHYIVKLLASTTTVSTGRLKLNQEVQ